MDRWSRQATVHGVARVGHLGTKPPPSLRAWHPAMHLRYRDKHASGSLGTWGRWACKWTVLNVQWSEVTSLSHVRLFATPWTVAHQAPPSMGFSMARILEWVVLSFSRGSSQPRDWTRVSLLAGKHFNLWATIYLIFALWGWEAVLFFSPIKS